MAAAPRTEAKLRKRLVPDDALIYREYAHQVMSKGEWGAYSRTARLCHVSHEHVRKVVARHRPQKPDNLPSYEPAPGEVEYVQFCEAHAKQIAAQKDEHHATLQSDAEFLCQLMEEELPTPDNKITSTPSSIASATPPESATGERTVHFTEYSIISNAGVSRKRQNRRIGFWYLAALTIVVTVAVILVAQKSLLLSLMMFVPVMGMWWVTLEFRRVVYLRE